MQHWWAGWLRNYFVFLDACWICQRNRQQIEDLLAWGFASAIAVVLLACTLVLLGIYNRFAGLDRLWG